jgi:hypothetical protein
MCPLNNVNGQLLLGWIFEKRTAKWDWCDMLEESISILLTDKGTPSLAIKGGLSTYASPIANKTCNKGHLMCRC